MRFDRIHLSRYGFFTDHVIDFKPPLPTGDFHIIYGPNEAGKSTLRNACIDFLFGIQQKSKYNFLHDYAVMEIGAHITVGNKTFEARRTKGIKNTLQGLGGSAISELHLKEMLGAISSRESYEQMYSLDDDSLEKGGNSILDSQGDLGELLFSAMSGLPGITASLGQTHSKAEAFFKNNSRSDRLTTLKQELEAIKTKLRENDVETSTYGKLREQAAQAKTGWEQVQSERDEQLSRCKWLQSLLGAHPVWREFREAEEKLVQLEDAPNVPEGWDKEIDGLIERQAKADAIYHTEQEAVRRAEQELQAITIDEEALAIASQVKRLNEDELEARYRTSNDAPRRQEEQRNLQEKIKLTLTKLGQKGDIDASDLILPAAVIGELRDLIEKRGALFTRLQDAEREWEEAQLATRQAAAVCHESADVIDLEKLVQGVKQSKNEPTLEHLKAANEACRAAKASEDVAITALGPWNGNSQSVMMLEKPAGEILKHLIGEQRHLATEQQSMHKEASRLKGELLEAEAVISALLEQAKIISDEDATASRENYESAWRQHRDNLHTTALPPAAVLQETADHVAEAFAAYDRLQTIRLTQTSEIAQLRQAYVKKARTAASYQEMTKEIEALEKKVQDHQDTCSSLLTALSLPVDYPLISLEAWLSRLDNACEKIAYVKKEEERLQRLEVSHIAAQERLDAVMRAHNLAGAELPWPDKLECCEAAIQAWKLQKQQEVAHKEALTKAQEAEDKRRLELARAQKYGEEWAKKWSACLASGWIGQQSPEAVKEILHALESLEADIQAEANLAHRIEAMTRDREAYVAEIKRIKTMLPGGFTTDDPLVTADLLRQRVSQAEETKRAHEKASKALLDAQNRFAKAKEDKAGVQDRYTHMRASIPADSLEHLREKIRCGLQRTALLVQINKLGKNLVELLSQETIENALAIMEAHVSNTEAVQAIKQEHMRVESNLKDVGEQVSRKYHEWKETEKQLTGIGTDSRSAELEEQKSALLLQIADESHKFMQLSAGVMLASEALRHYREMHRSSMMAAASEAFVLMTRGAFKSLEAKPQANTEILYGIRADGSSIIASEMSRGTRYQLYLALRIAGHAEFARHGDSLPFFADDILEPFDDDRSRETFDLLHTMSKNGQVVYLTHHRHLCDLAKTVTNGQVVIHELPDRAVPHKNVG